MRRTMTCDKEPSMSLPIMNYQKTTLDGVCEIEKEENEMHESD